MDVMIGLTVLGALLALYFLPTIIAYNREHHNKFPIFLVNLFLGWTLLVWFICFVWSFTSPPPKVVVIDKNHIKKVA